MKKEDPFKNLPDVLFSVREMRLELTRRNWH